VGPGPFFGRIVERDHADLDLCRKWLDVCDDYHTGSLGQCVGTKTSRGFLQDSLRLIDVNKRIIIKGATDETQYVALSYVWGEDKMKREMPRSLKTAVQINECGVETIELPEGLPRTIRDAIEVTRAIGYRYLWVDSLCIVQDDQQDRHSQINMMDEIYSNATLTIAAGSGLRKFT
jgi:Heterokaryon incompatibility protein (HET)